ncbi:hypothetical protein B0H17DRAFT_1216083 [Mycena rosella]|uniref:F-box domain-containing protein n=1 Tax=Mycena rosella TaxID=1033263 RepID=A0AAD7CCV5_MYCRO|nr:hypothetical protein B0H17DRAFT_1216083 [Mycena rosella]
MHLHSLPRELLSKCFRHTYGKFHKQELQYTAHHAIVTDRICHFWQDTAIADAEDWGLVFIDSFSDLQDIRTILKCAKDCALSIHIRLAPPKVMDCAMATGHVLDADTFAENTVDLLCPALVRCEYLYIYAPGFEQTDALIPLLYHIKANHIRMLVLNVEHPDSEFGPRRNTVPHLFNGDMPNLRSISFISTFISWGSAPYYRDAHTLRLSYVMTAIPLSDLFELLPFYLIRRPRRWAESRRR